MNLKKVFTLFLVLTLSLSLTGCSLKKKKTVTPTDKTSVVPNDREITLIWWNLFESKENVQPLIDAYKVLHPNVTIDYSQKELSDYQTNLDKVLTDGQPATTPDIFTVHNSWMGRYKNYIIAPPTQVIDTATFQKNFYPVASQDLIINNAPAAIPLGMDSLAIIYNKDLLASKGYTTPATDWTQLFDQSKNLTQKQNNTYKTVGLSMGAYDNNEFWFDTFNLLLLQSKVQMTSENKLEATFASDAAATEAVTYMNSYEKNSLWNSTLKKDVALFLDEKLAMYIAPSWRLNDIIFYNNTYNLGINYGIAPMPQLSSLESESVGWSNYWAQTVAMDSTNSAVAWDFLNFASQPEQLRLLYTKAKETRAFGQIYPRVDMKSELAEDTNLKVYVDEVAQSKSWYMVDGKAVKASFQKWVNGTQTAESTQSAVTTIITNTGFLKPQ